MEDWARKHKTGSSCFVSPLQALELVDEYFCFARLSEMQYAQILMDMYGLGGTKTGKPVKVRGENAGKRDPADDFDLDALLGGI